MSAEELCGTPEKPNLDMLSKYLSLSLARYEEFIGLGIRFGNASGPLDHHLGRHPESVCKKLTKPLYATPEKPNTARSEIPVFIDDKEVGTLCSILFCPGDGTGAVDEDRGYTINNLIIPKRFQFNEKPERIIPTKKTCAFEVALPLFSVYENKLIPNEVVLEELSLADNGITVTQIGVLGTDTKKYYQMAENAFAIDQTKPHTYFTVGHRVDGTRFGDPHAIYHNKDFNVMQVVGFLSVETADSPLARILRTNRITLRVLQFKPYNYLLCHRKI